MQSVTRSQAILIAGPTASGKSALALAVAERFGMLEALHPGVELEVHRQLRGSPSTRITTQRKNFESIRR